MQWPRRGGDRALQVASEKKGKGQMGAGREKREAMSPLELRPVVGQCGVLARLQRCQLAQRCVAPGLYLQAEVLLELFLGELI